MKNLIQLALILIFLISCDVSSTKQEEPEIESKLETLKCADFSTLRVVVNEIDTSGVDISFGIPFALDSVSNLELIFTSDLARGVDFSVEIPESSLSNKIDTTITQNLICGLDYDIEARIYSESEFQYCNSKLNNFISEGSLNKSPWCLKTYDAISGFDHTEVVQSDEYLFYLYQNGSFHSIDTLDLRFKRREPFPFSGTTGTQHTGFTFNNSIYYQRNNSIFEYDEEEDSWEHVSVGGIRTINDHEPTFAQVLDAGVYIFNSVSTSFFDPVADTTSLVVMREHSALPNFIGSFKSAHSIFGINRFFEIVKMDTKSGNWTKVADYPGNKSLNITTFPGKNEALIGLSYDPSDEANTDLWSFDLESYAWTELEPFPFNYRRIQSHEISSISTDSRLYFYFDNYNNQKSYLWHIPRNRLQKKE